MSGEALMVDVGKCRHHCHHTSGISKKVFLDLLEDYGDTDPIEVCELGTSTMTRGISTARPRTRYIRLPATGRTDNCVRHASPVALGRVAPADTIPALYGVPPAQIVILTGHSIWAHRTVMNDFTICRSPLPILKTELDSADGFFNGCYDLSYPSSYVKYRADGKSIRNGCIFSKHTWYLQVEEGTAWHCFSDVMCFLSGKLARTNQGTSFGLRIVISGGSSTKFSDPRSRLRCKNVVACTLAFDCVFLLKYFSTL